MTDLTLDPADTATAFRPPAPVETRRAVGGRIDAAGVGQHAGGRQILHDVSFSIDPGELVALVGGSGAGKTTLLEILAGLRAPSAGRVTHDGVRVDAGAASGSGVGYVPQDDIIHVEMPLRRTLQYAARLRLPAGTSSDQADRVVDETMRDLDLADRRDVAVRMLSGGQRKRASIAVELLTQPRTFFLDEPTSGLDPSTSADVLRLLRQLAQRGVTVLLTTHEPATIERCDRVVFLARNGHLAFAGTPSEARQYFRIDDLADIYDRLASEDTPRAWAERFAAWRQPTEIPLQASARPDDRRSPPVLRQWWLLTRRNADVLIRNRLTLAVLLGSPVLVTAMMGMLFQPGAFEPQSAADVGPAQIVFWIAFAGFFFGLTYGLLQIVGEMAVFRRERRSGLSVGAYVASKIAVLLPVLTAVTAVLLGVLRALERLPAAGWDVYASLLATLLIEAVSALALGLLASAAVSNASQAALALRCSASRRCSSPARLFRSTTWRLPGACSAWAWPTATRSRHWGVGCSSTRSGARSRACAPTATPSPEPSLTAGWCSQGSPRSSRWPPCGCSTVGAWPARTDGDEADQRLRAGPRSYAVSCREPRGSVVHQAVVRRSRRASPHPRRDDWQQHRLLRPASGGRGPR
jgi:ABC-type multidrug transport system ATPase subunit